MLRRLLTLLLLLIAPSALAQTVYLGGPLGGGSGGGGGGGGGLAATGGTGFVVETAPTVTINRQFTNTDGCLVWQNADGVSADPIVNADDNCLVKFSSGAGDPPATCTPPELYYESDVFELSWCSNTNTWEFIITQNAQTDDAVIVGSGTGFQLKVMTNGALSYATATNTFSQATFANVAASTSAELRGVLSDEVGAGLSIFLDGSGNFDLGGTRTAFGALAVISAQTGTASTTAAQSGYVITNTGDADGSTNNLLDNPTAGVTYSFAVTVAQTITVAPASGETLYMNAAACANVTSATIGAALSVVAVTGGSGGVWVASGAGWTCN